MTAYKFLAKRALGPISGYAWPLPRGEAPAAWIAVEGPLALCTRGIHVCRTLDLAHWLHDELWEVETSGDELEGLDCIIVRRARLVRCIDSWSEGGAASFVDACIEHATTLCAAAPDATVGGYIHDAKLAASGGHVAVSAFCAALAVAKLDPDVEDEPAYRRERAWEADWITRKLIGA